jgi:hypothetical protein
MNSRASYLGHYLLSIIRYSSFSRDSCLCTAPPCAPLTLVRCTAPPYASRSPPFRLSPFARLASRSRLCPANASARVVSEHALPTRLTSRRLLALASVLPRLCPLSIFLFLSPLPLSASLPSSPWDDLQTILAQHLSLGCDETFR